MSPRRTSSRAANAKPSPREVDLEHKLEAALARIAELEHRLELHQEQSEQKNAASAKRARTGSSVEEEYLKDENLEESTCVLPDELIPVVLKFLDPGLDWPQCRRVNRAWHSTILSIDKKHLPWRAPFLWTGPLRLRNTEGWNERLQSDLDNVQRTPAAERKRLIALQLEEDGDDDPDWTHFWRRTDVEELSEDGAAFMHDWRTRPSIASAQVALTVRDARLIVEQDGNIESKSFSFAGAKWFFNVGVRIRDEPDGSNERLMGVGLQRDGDAPAVEDKRSDLADFVLDDDIPCAIRYRASFTAGARTFRAADFSLEEEGVDLFEPSCWNHGGGGIFNEFFPMSIGQFALGSPPAYPYLHISIELEFLGYAYYVP